MNEKSEALPPWYFNRTQEEIENLINTKVDLKKLSFLWENPKFHIAQIGDVSGPEFKKTGNNDGIYLLYLSYEEIDSDALDKEYKKFRFTTRKWALAPNASDDEIERTVYKLLENSLEHRLGEFFFWDKARTHSPHIELHDRLFISFEKKMERLQEKMKNLKDDNI